jgi:hypothetical protein
MDWSAEGENVVKDVLMQINNAYMHDIKKGFNSIIFEFPIILKSDFRPSGLPVIITGETSLYIS